MKKVFIALCMLTVLFSVFASGGKDKDQNSNPVFAVSILPQSYFVREIAGDTVDLLVLAGEGQSPHSYEPTPVQIAKLSAAKIWILSGTDFETSFKKKVTSQFPSIKIVDGTKGVVLRELHDWEKELEDHHEGESEDPEEGGVHDGEDDEHAEEQSGEAHEHDVDRHTWLGKENAKIMAFHIYESLVEINPPMKDVYTEKYEILLSSIDNTFSVLHKQLDGLNGKSILVFHPSFGYFLDEFGIRQLSVETGGKEPSARVLAELIERAKKEKIPAIFVQKQFPVTAAQKIAAETGAKVVALDPLSADWLNNLQTIGNALVEVYK
ncbi:MAG TPA: zinc ABC transporter substrate-binding protein [Treponemataceae bacterium]|nr:zinc ABC transporter substrate-binding protein [Treponemataceae bacterium]